MKIVQILALLITMSAPAWAQSSSSLFMEIHTAKNFTDQQYDRLMQAKQLVEMIINSPAFKSRVLNFNGGTFIQNNGLTNLQIYELLMSGAEKYPQQTEVDGAMDYDLVLYKPKWYQSKKVLGYTSQDTRVVHINKLFFNKADINEIAMNLVHEWTHKMGFGHDFKKTARRPYSVPYGVGYIVRDLGNKILQQ